MKIFLLSVLSAGLFAAPAPFPDNSAQPAWQSLGGATFAGWSGLAVAADGSAELVVPGEAVYTVPAGPRGAYGVGLWGFNDSTLDARKWYGVRFDLALDRDDAPFVGSLTTHLPPLTGRDDIRHSAQAPLRLQGKGWHALTVPFSAFDYYRGQDYVLKNIKQLVLTGHYETPGAEGGSIHIRNLRLIRGDVLHLQSDIRSRPADAGGTVAYETTVTNCTETPQVITLALERSGWEGMTATVTPAALTLAPGQSRVVTIAVTVPAWLPAGAQEKQTLVVTPQDHGEAAEKIEFITLRRLPFPYLVHTADGWDEVRAKVKTYAWARDELADIVRQSDAFEVPTVPPEGLPTENNSRAVFKSQTEHKLFPCAIAWKLTGDRRHAEKVALFLRRLADPDTGYPKHRHLTNLDIPQEGGFWEICAWSYDMIQDAGVLTPEDRRLIENSFRLYTDWLIDGLGNGGISNWSVFNLCPAAQCALVIQDMVRFNTLLNGPAGIIDHLRYGTMDDGWWYEMALSYNLGCAEAFTNLALAARPFGIDLINAQFPVATTRIVGLRPFEFQAFQGMAFGKYGPVKSNTVSIKKMWDGIVPYPDYRGVMFGMGDGHEDALGGGRLEKAYFVFRDPAYAAIIKQGKKRDLLYGVPELPADTPRTYAVSARSDDAGIAVLRSQTSARPPREQIQSVLKYGTHGSYHGHFDRMALNSLMRYGRSFYNPETSWFGYASYMYKWWVQPSLSHNMVVVDAKMQEPAECTPLLFHGGAMMQVVAAETNARWSNPPYFGGYDQLEAVKKGDKPYVVIPADHPKPTEVAGFTESVRQRRLMIVTDDYVVLADDLLGDRDHTYDNLLHLRGAQIADLAKAKLLRHDNQFDSSPLSSGQFITNVDRYAVTTPALFHSIHRVAVKNTHETGWNYGSERNWETGGASSLSEPGVLQINAHVLWPQKVELALGDYPEKWLVSKKLTYEVKGDDRTLAGGTFGAWMLGSGDIDVDVSGLKTLRLTTRTQRADGTLWTIFWGDAVLLTSGGQSLPLSKLKPVSRNVAPTSSPGRDYAGGPVRIAGQPIADPLAAEPADDKEDAVLTFDLSGLGAVRFKARVGGDWPVGDEEQLRKVCSVRTTGRHAQFLTLIEPYEDKPLVKSASATGPGRLQVELADGRIQDLTIENLDGTGKDVTVNITETLHGKVSRSESAAE
ncbi:MAG: hypothetical protein JF599_11565 [Verrucomicrobia bacterium]|nr:hypothetical protein [Verrucomicrobiota bacterium]